MGDSEVGYFGLDIVCNQIQDEENVVFVYNLWQIVILYWHKSNSCFFGPGAGY